MDIIKPYIEYSGGISLKAANDKFLSLTTRGDRSAIEAHTEVKDRYTRFQASVCDEKLVLKAENRRYLSRIESQGIQYLEAEKEEVDIACKFRVYEVDKESREIALQADNDLFVSLVTRDDVPSIEVVKGGIDNYSKFVPEVGDLIAPTFTILEVTWNKPANYITNTSLVVDTESFINRQSHPIKEELTLSATENSKQTTSWKTAWGFGAEVSFKASIPEAGELGFKATLSYSGEHGISSTVEHTRKFERKFTFEAAPKKMTVFKLLVQKSTGADVPFTAKVLRKRATGEQDTICQDGTWSGVAYHSATVDAKESPIPKKH